MSPPPPKRKRACDSAPSETENQLQPPSQNGEAASTNVVAELRELLGENVVLLPIKRGSKRPHSQGWQHFTPERMKDPGYLSALNHGGNIGVLLGNGLVTIDLDCDEAVEPFLALNPKLRQTLRTKRKRGCNLWARINGAYPKSGKLKTGSGADIGEWRADGNQTVIYGEAIDRKKGETNPTAYKIENRVKPIELAAFDEIKWPTELAAAVEKRIGIQQWRKEHRGAAAALRGTILHRRPRQPAFSE